MPPEVGRTLRGFMKKYETEFKLEVVQSFFQARAARWDTDWEVPPDRQHRDRPTSGGHFRPGAIR